MSRPIRTRITNELGNLQTLPEDKGQFEVIPGGEHTIFLGLGPQPELVTEYFPEVPQAIFIESADLTDQITDWQNMVPANFTELSPDEFTPELAANATIIRYRPGLKSFPSFWGPLTARTVVSRLPHQSTNKIIWLPFGEEDLLGKELTIAFEAKGYAVRHLDKEMLERSAGTELPALLKNEKPELFFSINFKGLEPFGLGFNILREAGVKVAVWLVDNPFNILTSVKSGYWKDAHLFVTDHTFIGPLIQCGAKWVTHLPLAACPELFAKNGTLPDHAKELEDKLVFVGRSEFPKKNKFFAGLTPNERLLEEAIAMLDSGQRPHFHWWEEHIRATLWPGNDVRHVGIGAEVAGHAWRTRCLSASGENTIIFGDDEWKQNQAITAEVRPLLDYYAHLPSVYKSAAVNLNVTGMQLPAGLTQRHFDVWCAGGFLITDANPGMKIFPKELVEPVTFETANDIEALFAQFQKDSACKSELRVEWREHILKEHTYHNRATTIFKTMELSWTWIIP